MRYEKGEVSKLSTEIGCLGWEKGESEGGGGGGGSRSMLSPLLVELCCSLYAI